MALSIHNVNARALEIGKDLLLSIPPGEPSLSSFNTWTREIMMWCLANPHVKGRVLRFVDVLPSLKTDRAITQHLRDYFPAKESRLPLTLRGGTVMAHAPFTGRAVSSLTRRLATEVAQQFICGSTQEDAFETIKRFERQKMTVSLDVLGEAVLSDQEADQYQKMYLDLLERLPEGQNLSIKLSGLTPHFDPLSFDATVKDVLNRLLPILLAAKKRKSFINIDAEHYDVRELTLTIVQKALSHPRLKRIPNVGIVSQAYFKDAEQSLLPFLNWAKKHKQPLTVRLVKGAYWDSEVARAEAKNWPVPVFTDKGETDIQFEKLARVLMEKRDNVRLAVGSHNIRSLSYVLALQEALQYPEDQVEFQLLYGMADTLKTVLASKGKAVRVYSPFGPFLPGMSYLVRRLLENSSNESFLHFDLTRDFKRDDLLAPPHLNGHKNAPPHEEATRDLAHFQNEPRLDFSQEKTRAPFQEALDHVMKNLGKDYKIIINGRLRETLHHRLSRNPASPKMIVGQVAKAEWKDVDDAIRLARDAQRTWNGIPPPQRADCLFRAADGFRQKRVELAAWEVLETGHTWREADTDITEAIDFLEYYGRAMAEMAAKNSLQQAPGETNRLRYQGRGLAAIIAPWNFPLAILTGMTSAALVTGNAALVKPAETAGILASFMVQNFLEAGIPKEVIAFLPGSGEEIGRGLLRHPHIDLIAFTGSKEVGLSLIQEAGHTLADQTHVKKVVAEMGGKNAIIVDEDADFDEALQGVVASAFGYQGQKCSACSRLILLDRIYQPFTERLIEATRSLKIGPPIDPRTDIGPVIDLDAYQKIQSVIEEGKREGRLLFQATLEKSAQEGYFIAPAIFSDVPMNSILSREEIFGPVLTVFRAAHFDEALDLANDSQFALTGGLFSRHLSHIERAKKEFNVGNLYINRQTTGAMVGRQPFGGFKMSGLGTKAGGVEYLSHFMLETTITENTLRHGFPL